MTRSPSSELPAAAGNSAPQPEPEHEPAWVDGLRTLIKEQGERLDAFDKRLGAFNANLTLLARSYQNLAQQVQLLGNADQAVAELVGDGG